QVERLGAHLEVHLLRDLDLLDQARVHAQEARAVENQVGVAAVAREALDAAAEAGRRDEAPRGRARREAERVEVERADRVLRDVVRQPEDLTVALTDLDGLLQVFDRQTDELHVAEANRRAALEADRAVHTPVAEEAVEQAAVTRQVLLAIAERQLVD